VRESARGYLLAEIFDGNTRGRACLLDISVGIQLVLSFVRWSLFQLSVYLREHTYKFMSHFKSQCIQEILSTNGRNGCVVGEYTRGRGREEGWKEGRKREGKRDGRGCGQREIFFSSVQYN
jgi:hypothetical protein